MTIQLVEDLYVQHLADALDAEKQMLRMMPTIEKALVTDEITQAVSQHMKTTEEQVTCLGGILSQRDARARKQSKVMAGLLAEAQDLLEQPIEDPELLEAALVLAAQKMEAFEAVCYASLHNFARILNRRDDARILQQIWAEERRMHDVLAGFAESLEFEAIEAETPVMAAR